LLQTVYLLYCKRFTCFTGTNYSIYLLYWYKYAIALNIRSRRLSACGEAHCFLLVQKQRVKITCFTGTKTACQRRSALQFTRCFCTSKASNFVPEKQVQRNNRACRFASKQAVEQIAAAHTLLIYLLYKYTSTNSDAIYYLRCAACCEADCGSAHGAHVALMCVDGLERPLALRRHSGTHFTCFPGTNVQILVQKYQH
jgi:hypothetical protein